MNKRILLGALMIVCSLGTLTPVGIVIIFWEYFKKAIKIDFYTVYLVMRLFIWLTIQLPLGLLKVSTEKISSAFHQAISAVTHRPKMNAVFFGFSLLISVFLFPNFMLSLSEITDLGAIMSSLWAFLKGIGFATLTTILLNVIYVTLSSNEIAKVDPRKTSAAGAYQGMSEGFKESAEGVQTGEKVYRDIDPEKATKAATDVVKFWKEDDIQAILTSLSKMLPGVGKKAAKTKGAKKAAARAGAEAVERVEMGTAGPTIFVAAFVILVVQWLVLLAIIGAYLNFIIPMIASPLLGAFGLGEAYASWIGGEVGDQYLAGAQLGLDDEIATVMEARQRVFCMLEGPACLRQWQLNNTRTPDSQNVGEEYKLNLDRFEVGSGDQVDVAYKDGSYRLPISFGLSNARNGIYGINALNVSYRLKVIDFSRDNMLQAGSDPYCETRWRPVQGYDIREPDDPASIEVEGQDDPIEYKGNDLYPGTSAATGFMRLDKIDLRNCALLQPGAGETKTVLLEVKYDYYSEATLYFEAMARQVMQESKDVQIEWKTSETADTPVKSVLNVNSPVLYEQDEAVDDAAIPFDMRTSLSAEGSDVEYRVNNLEVIKSEEVKIADEGGNCQLEPESDGSDVLEPTGKAEQIIEGESGEGSESSDGRWFSSANPPPFFGCSMELSDPAQINPNGQTLSMDVRSNYTVKLNQQLEKFRVLNTRCSSLNCPLLVTQQYVENEVDEEDEVKWKIKCTGPDASDGCSVVKGDPERWSTINDHMMTGDDLLDSKLESGEIAFEPFEAGVVYDENGHKSELKENMSGYREDVGAAIGLRERQLSNLMNRQLARQGVAVLSVPQREGGIRGSEEPSRDVEVVNLDERVCRNKREDMTLLEKYKERTGQEKPFEEEYDLEVGEKEYQPYLISFIPLDETCN